MKNKYFLTLLILTMLIGVCHAQRYHYEVDESEVRTRNSGGNANGNEQWEYRETQRPLERRQAAPGAQKVRAPYAGYAGPGEYPYTRVYPFFLEFGANDEALEMTFGHLWEETDRNFRTTLGGSILYKDDAYQFVNLFFLLGDRLLFERFRLDIGFTGILGTVEQDDHDTEGDVGALGFTVGGAYNFPEIEPFYGLPLDFEIAGSFTLAPDPLCFQDLNHYREFRITGGFYVLEQKKGLVFMGYRSIDTGFDDGGGRRGDEEWDERYGAFVFGYRFIF